ncbi:hypothetical protein ARAM_005248, partial [Aspergillus rambellii]
SVYKPYLWLIITIMLIRSTTGVAPAPEGVTPDFNDSSGHLKTTGETIAAVALTLSTSCLVMRIYTKMHLLRRFWIDDGYSDYPCLGTVRIGSINSPVYVPSNPYFLQPNKIMPSDGYSHSGYGIHIWNITVSRLGSYERVGLHHPLLLTIIIDHLT